LEQEGFHRSDVKMEEQSPDRVRQKQRRTRVVKRLVERPKTVYERFPAFERDKVLDFSELFKGYTVRKSRLSKKPFHSECISCPTPLLPLTQPIVESVYPRKREPQRGFLDAVVGDTKRQVENKRVEEVVASGSVEVDLRIALEVHRFIRCICSLLTFSLHRNVKDQVFQSLYRSTTAHSTLYSCQTGKIKLFTNPTRILRILHHPKPVSRHLPTRFLSLAPGHEASYGAPGYLSAISHN
jgi:hypothetical protein